MSLYRDREEDRERWKKVTLAGVADLSIFNLYDYMMGEPGPWPREVNHINRLFAGSIIR